MQYEDDIHKNSWQYLNYEIKNFAIFLATVGTKTECCILTDTQNQVL
jgi:hypothetical protein